MASIYPGAVLDPDLDARVRSEWRGGERFVWVGCPRLRRCVQSAAPAVLLSIRWMAFAARKIRFATHSGRGPDAAVFS